MPPPLLRPLLDLIEDAITEILLRIPPLIQSHPTLRDRTMPPPLPRPLPDLIEDAITEILLRIPPDEPEHLFRAALVCKAWRRILTDPSFRRRYSVFHRAPPLLGYLYSPYNPYSRPVLNPAFMSTTAASPLTTPEHGRNWSVVDCRHGHVLIRKICSRSERLIVWDPITGDQEELSMPNNMYPFWFICNAEAAVLCDIMGSCDHLDCHAGVFRVVFCGMDLSNTPYKTWVTVYSSETREWSSMVSIVVDNDMHLSCSTLIGNAVYFRLECSLRMLKYDLGRHELSVISSPGVKEAAAMELDDGGLGFVAALDNCIYTWSWQTDANNGIGSWAQHKVMELETVLPRGGNDPHFPRQVIGLVEGTDTIFINVDAGLFTLDLKSRKVKKIGETVGCRWIIPYMSFYTPDCGRFSALVSHEAC